MAPESDVPEEIASPHSLPQRADPGANAASRRRWEIIILVTMYLGYSAFMLCRNTLIASSATMIDDPSLDLDTARYGQLMAWHHAGAICGKLVTGVGADLIGGRRMFLLALALTGTATAAFGMVSSFFLFGILNFLGQFFKAGGWPAMAKIIGEWYPVRKYGTVWSIVSTSSRVGTIGAGLAVAFVLTLASWRAAFMTAAMVTGFVVVLGYMWLKECPKDVGLSSTADEDSEEEGHVRQPHSFDEMTLPQACLAFAKSARIWLICLSIAFLTILMDFIIFIPSYLTQELEIDPAKAPLGLSTFAGGMFVALIVTSFFYDRLSKRQLVGTLGGLLSMSCCCVLLLWCLGGIPLAPGMRLPTAMVSIFVFGFTISPAYYVPMSVFSVAFGGKHSGFLIALIDVFGYSGAMVFTFFGGSIAKDYGWSVFLAILLTITLLSLVTMTTFLHLDFRAQRRESDTALA